MKVAFTSSDGNFVDCHFGSSEAFFVWEVASDKARCLGPRSVPDRDGQEDRIIARANLLSDCAIVCTEQIGGPAAAKLVARHIHPVKTVAATPVTEFVQRLQGVLRGHPAPWLRKAMGLPPVPLADSPDQTA
ncbi:MAG: nitrogen fixation protein NifX [Polyangia bacterium]|jgi:nitrogen fixation protein NifX